MDIANIEKLILECEERCEDRFKSAEIIALKNQKKVLDSFRNNKIALRHFSGTTGYAYDDIGRQALSRIFADTFKAEDAIVSPLFASGTHTIAAALFGILRPGDTALSISGKPYNTLLKVIDCGEGSLKEFKIEFSNIELNEADDFDFPAIENAIKKYNPSLIYIQRAKGYAWRKALSIEKIKKAANFVKKICSAPIIVDNCYGEFAEEKEPIETGANLIMGSLIKNPGGGLAPSGGYIAGDCALIKKIEGRYSAPGVGFEIGAYPYGYQYFFQGFFMAPHVVLQAQKASLLFGEAFSALGYEVLGYEKREYNLKNSEKTLPDEMKNGKKKLSENSPLENLLQTLPSDITCAIKFKTADELITFCRAIQASSPVDGHVVPHPWAMPGYDTDVIMAAGTFIQGSSIELSADAPIKEPYIAYMQGSLTYEHAKIALLETIKNLTKLL